jgi:hypothetical protein
MTVALCRLGVLIGALTLLPAQSKQWRGTWSATLGGSGRTLGGAWTATVADDPNVAYGSWTMLDSSGKQLGSGTWSARKAENHWEGAWRAWEANVEKASGTWSARSLPMSPSGFSALLEAALSNVASGTWKAGRAAGGWSIRAYRQR